MCAGTGKGQIGQRWKLLTNIEKYGQRSTIMDKYGQRRLLWTQVDNYDKGGQLWTNMRE